MLRDVFYFGKKPNVHPREQFAENLQDARLKATTRDFWIINEFSDYRNFDWDFDFEFLPDEDVWAEDHNNVWPSQHQKDSGTWLCPKEHSDVIVYRNDVDPVIRKNEKTDHWVELDLINHNKFDFSWHPDPTDPPYIYKWGCKFFPTEIKHVLEYRVPGATQEKYMNTIAELVPEYDRWVEHQTIDKDRFDMSWRPNPLDPPFIYVWGNKYVDGRLQPTLEYHAPNATDIKYLSELVPVLPEQDRWTILEDIVKDSFDFSWRPDPREPAFIYVFGNEQYDGTIMPTLEYRCPNATEIKYVNDITAKLAPKKELFEHLEDSYGIDYSWRPNPTSPPYIYAWGNQWNSPEEKISIQFVVPGATEYKYMTERAIRKPCMDNWVVPDDVDATGFDFSWEPNPTAPPYIYEFATQWQKTGGPQYVVPGATEKQYVDFQRVKRLPTNKGWAIPNNIDIDRFDFSWHPDSSSPPYVYVFSTQWAFSGGPVYTVDGATEVKYVEDQVATAIVDMNNWVYDATEIDVDSFDFSWHPHAEDQPYIYQFGTQWQKTGGPKYITSGADNSSPVKYVDTRIIKAMRLSNPHDYYWVENYPIKDFDYSWHPDDTEEPYIYVFGNKQYPAEECPTIEYRMEGATQVKYIHDIVATLDVDMTNWVIHEPIDEDSFDFSWVPNPTDQPYIYVFGNQRYSGEIYPTVEYRTPNATEKKYVSDVTAKLKVDKSKFTLLYPINEDKFDFRWRPNPMSPPYIYIFGNQYYSAEEMPTVEYRVDGATEIKYVKNITAHLKSNMTNWEVPSNIDVSSFDFSWVPHPKSPPYIYEFATVWNDRGGPRYIVKGATEYKYIEEIKAKTLPDKTNWDIPNNIDISSFDFSWVPHPNSPPYIYEFGTQWNDRGGPVYRMPGATEYKYIDTVKANTLPSRVNWEIPDGVDVRRFDFSWAPHPMAPPYIYQFGTKLDNNDGPRYVTPSNNGEIVYLERVELLGSSDISVGQYYIETSLEELINKHPKEIFWAMRKNIDYSHFDFSWRPTTVEVAYELDYVHVFGSPESELTQTYFVSAEHYLKGNTEFKFVEDLKLNEDTLAKLFKKPDMFFIDRSNSESQERFEKLKERFPGIQKTRYLNSWVDTINRCTKKASTELIWVLNSELDYSDFNFDYYPNPWQMKMVQVFGTQWSHWGTTFMVNCETFPEDTRYVKIIEHLSNLNFVKDIRTKATQCVHDIVVIDHANKETSDVVSFLQSKVSDNTITVIPYQESYLETFKEIISKQQEKKDHYIWICSSVCNYTNFDFSYVCDPFARDQLHVFPSGTQKFGDTFFVDVNKAREVISDLELLESFNKVNYNMTIRAERLPEPVIVVNDDTHSTAINKIIDFPYATLVTYDNTDVPKVDIEPMNLWSSDTKNIYVTSTGATRIVVPVEAKDYVKKELYEYPYIKRAPKLATSKPLDIVYLSNGETGADENYQYLLDVTKDLPNRVVRVDGINGRVAAYHAAAEASETTWMFTVFAKLKVNPKFDWNWQPDRMQAPKHYIFYAKNPVNGLTYGHQAMIAYNKKLTLANEGKGLDFTLDDEHEVVPLISGTANYNTDEFSTWRTAFREVIKLKADSDDIAKYRLDAWLTKGEGNFAEYSIKGALDAEKYYDDVGGDFDMIKLSYEWDWLRNKFNEM